jgi:CheY-like chemotaxis protein
MTARFARRHHLEAASLHSVNELVDDTVNGFDGVRLLLVDDEPVNRAVATEFLERQGFHVDVAEDGLEALSMLGMHEYRLVLMDMQMPRLDGIESTRQLRRQRRHDQLPIIAMTANAFAEDKKRCLDAGMNDFISKPIDFDHLTSTIKRWL